MLLSQIGIQPDALRPASIDETPKRGEMPRTLSNRLARAKAEAARDQIAHFKCPTAIEFTNLPKTSTGKIQKFVLREEEWAGHDKRIKG